MREGHVFVGVSAQVIGANRLVEIDPERYAEINLTNEFAADAVFSQAAMAVRTQSKVLGGECQKIKAIIAMGQSQSGMRIAMYANATQPNDQIYDGFFNHTGMETNADIGVPVFNIFSMTEGNGTQPEGPNFTKWVVAGATHNDRFIMERGMESAVDVGMDVQSTNQCVYPTNDFPAWRVYNAALDSLIKWVLGGEKPFFGEPLEGNGGMLARFTGGGYELDDNGNVLGGVRSPDIEVPIARHATSNSAVNPNDFIAGMACGLAGTAEPFTEEKLLELYPTHDDYIEKYIEAADKALEQGIWLKEDYLDAIKEAKNAPIPN